MTLAFDLLTQITIGGIYWSWPTKFEEGGSKGSFDIDQKKCLLTNICKTVYPSSLIGGHKKGIPLQCVYLKVQTFLTRFIFPDSSHVTASYVTSK